MRVLIACSDASVRDRFLDALQRVQIAAISVADAATTIELTRQQRPDIVLLDDALPEMGGVHRIVGERLLFFADEALATDASRRLVVAPAQLLNFLGAVAL